MFIVKLQVGDDDNTYVVYEYDLEFSQSIDQTGKVSSKVKGGVINVTVVLDENYLRLLQWMLDEKKAYDGSLKFYISDPTSSDSSDDDSSSSSDDNPAKKIEFKTGVLVRYHEYYSANAFEAAVSKSFIKLSITANEITMDQLENPFSKNWDSEATT